MPKSPRDRALALIAIVLSLVGTVALADGGGILLHDNGPPDGSNGYSNATEEAFGIRRTLLDDFVVPAGQTWVIERFVWRHGFATPGGGARGTGAEIALWTDAGGVPREPFAMLALTDYQEITTGNLPFSREELESWVAFEPVALGAGHYWFEATVIGPENNFWFTASPVQHSECWVNYDDFNGLESGTDHFGVPSDLNWSLFGLIGGTGSGACCLPGGACGTIAAVACNAQGGIYLGDGSVCSIETCGETGACCLPGAPCSTESELFCDARAGAHAGGGVSCDGYACRPDGPCGDFAAPDDYGVGADPEDVDVGDLDGDGDLDMVIVNRDAASISVLLNNGDCEFGSQMITETGSSPRASALGDLDGDLDLDLAVVTAVTTGIGVVCVYMNNGDATWGPRVDYITGATPFDVVMADLDGDLDLDLAVVNWGHGTVAVLLNDGGGAFGTASVYTVGSVSPAIAVGDLDGDLDLDLITVSPSDRTVSLLSNAGDATFTPQTFSVVGRPRDVELADVDGDLDLDVVTANFDTVSVLLNDGRASFAPEGIHATLLRGTTNLVVADLDGDSDPDVAVSVLGDFGDLVGTMFNNGQGVFGPTSIHYPAGGRPGGLAADDLDGDEDIDLVVVSDGINIARVFKSTCFACPEDLDDSNSVDVGDILLILTAWGNPGGPEDLDCSGTVDFGDLLVVLGAWGPCP